MITWKARFYIITTLSITTALLSSCGVPNSGSSTCSANVTSGEIKLLVSRVGQNSFSMQLCANFNSGDLVNIYGGNASSIQASSLYTNNTQPRLKEVANFIQAGSAIQVDFFSTDTHFAIYPVIFYEGTYQTDWNRPLVPSQALPK